jgi:uncharacterized protein with GYD domain
MPERYVVLVNWPEGGVDAASNLRALVRAAETTASAPVKLDTVLHCIGDIDLVLIVTADDSKAMNAFTLALQKSVRLVTLQAYDADEIDKIIENAKTIREGYIRSGAGGIS